MVAEPEATTTPASSVSNNGNARLVKAKMNRRPDGYLLGLFVLVILWGCAGHFSISTKSAAELEEIGRVRIYVIGITTLWLLFAYAAFALHREGTNVRSIIDPLPLTARRLGMCALIAIGMFLVWGLVSGVLGFFLRPDKIQIQNLIVFFPKEPIEKLLWILMSLSAAFCEEFVYRGYLQRCIQRLSGSVAFAVVVQALAYGFAHAALPWKVMVTVAFLGVLFGTVAAWRKSLVAGIIMHAAFDILAVFARK